MNPYSIGLEPSSGIYIAQLQDANKSSSYIYENALVVGNSQYGCYGSSALDPTDATFDHALFYANSSGDFGGKCGAANRISVTTGVNPNLTSIAYIDPASPAYTAGKAGKQVGADTRCRYISKFEGGGIVTEHVKQDMWPLPGFINDRVKLESQQIYGRTYDPNAIVLDALGPRDLDKLKCTDPLPPGTPPPVPPGGGGIGGGTCTIITTEDVLCAPVGATVPLNIDLETFTNGADNNRGHGNDTDGDDDDNPGN